jgi:hypothetical protein
MRKLERNWGAGVDFYSNAGNLAFQAYKGKDGKVGHGDNKAYRAAITAIEAEFREDLEVDHGIRGKDGKLKVDAAKATQLFQLAWDYGHASGYQDVANYYEDMVDLVR